MKLHALLGHHVSENIVSWCQALKNSSASLSCIQETYIISTILKVIQKCVICVWCLDNWSLVLSGKPFNTFSMVRLNKLQFRLTLTPLLTATHAFCFSLSTFYFHDLWTVALYGFLHGPPKKKRKKKKKDHKRAMVRSYGKF